MKKAASARKAKYFITESVFFLINVLVTEADEVIKKARHINKIVIHGKVVRELTDNNNSLDSLLEKIAYYRAY